MSQRTDDAGLARVGAIGHLGAMTKPERCELCEDPLTQGHDLVGGLALCRRCYLGDLQRVAQMRGWSLKSKHHEVRLRRDDDQRTLVTQVRIVIGAQPALRLRAQRFQWWMTLLGLLRRRARSSDPLFEANVRVWTRGPAQAEIFMKREGVESSLFDVLGNLLPSDAQIQGDKISVDYYSDDPHTEGEIVARVAVLALHLERFAAADAVPASPVAGSLYGRPSGGG
jgi:hypothetical protein